MNGLQGILEGGALTTQFWRIGQRAFTWHFGLIWEPQTPITKFFFVVCSPRICVTVCNTMASNTHDPAELGELEREILSIIWRVGEATAEQAREELNRPLKDSTVRTVLRRLEEKGYLAHTVDDRTFIYRPAQTRQKVAGRAVKRILDWFCEGSVEALLVGMVDSKVLDQAELQRLATRIAEAQKQAGKQNTSVESDREAKR
jgi:BlaI family transcriptional regulator, penicillinase repressor